MGPSATSRDQQRDLPDASETVPVAAMMVALAVCEVPTQTALEVLHLARYLRDEPVGGREQAER